MKTKNQKEWRTFLNQLWPDDKSSIEILRKFFKRLLMNRRPKCSLVLIGPSRSGKTTIRRILEKLVGDVGNWIIEYNEYPSHKTNLVDMQVLEIKKSFPPDNCLLDRLLNDLPSIRRWAIAK